MPRHCYVLRVFTIGGAGGNHLGAVTDRSGLSDRRMQEIAADLGFSETIYLDWRQAEVPRVRIFTPASEIPFAGHPLVGMTWVLNVLGPGGAGQIECGIGRVRSYLVDGVPWIEAPLNQTVRLLDHPQDYDPGTAVRSAAVVDMPLPYQVIEVADPAAVRGAPVPNGGMTSVYCWVDEATIHTRFFAPDYGVVEDPATGSAAVALAASLVTRGRPQGAVTILQGEEVGHPSRIHLRWSAEMAAIGGEVVKDEVRWLDV